jgi:hypothetical protein
MACPAARVVDPLVIVPGIRTHHTMKSIDLSSGVMKAPTLLFNKSLFVKRYETVAKIVAYSFVTFSCSVLRAQGS